MKCMKKIHLKNIVFAGAFMALCVILPMSFHALGGKEAGTVFCPMHIPVLVCGLSLGPIYGTLCGVFGPVLSHLFTGMPSVGNLYPMIVELAFYGFVSGIIAKYAKVKNTYAKIYISLISSMIIGRIASGVFKAIIFDAGEYSLSVWITTSFITCLPGIVCHIILVPAIVFALSKANLANLSKSLLV